MHDLLAKPAAAIIASDMNRYFPALDRPRPSGAVRTVTVLAALLAAPLPALSQTPEPALDPAAVDLVRAASAFLTGQQRISVDWFVSYDEVIDGREKLTNLRSGSNLLDREGGFRSYAEDGEQIREYIFDGATITAVHVDENAYASAPAAGSFGDLVATLQADYDLALPIWQILARDSDEGLLDGAESGAYLGLTRVAGELAHHLAFSSYDHDWQLWIAADPDRPVLLMLVGTDPYTQGWPQYRAYFSNWNFEPEVTEDAFTFVPDEGMDRMVWPRIGNSDEGNQ